ncbi:MAG: DUF454 domain-containing protein [Actinobacteria bacterium]|nr:DUF454 domain-containing protein [Actinomycetota bacterium]
MNKNYFNNKKSLSKPKRILFISLGTFFVALGVLGILLPVLPTTPFLLIAAALYARSSQRFYNWLLNNRFFGKYIKNYREGKGIPIKFKVFAITLLWITIGCSAFFAVKILIVRIILLLVAIGVTTHIIRIKTLKSQ